MFYQFFSRIKFLLQSTNQHGVHSPFVYNFVTKGLYKKTSKNKKLDFEVFDSLSTKKKQILLRILNYFNVDRVFTDVTQVNEKSKDKWNVLYLDKVNSKNFLIPNPNYFVVVNNIHKSKSALKSWQYLIKNKQATVTIDLFYFGLIFFRKEQVKEHFKIRV